MTVVHTVVANHMTVGLHSLCDLRVLSDILTDQEKTRFDVVMLQNIQNHRAVRYRAVVKGEGDLFDWARGQCVLRLEKKIPSDK